MEIPEPCWSLSFVRASSEFRSGTSPNQRDQSIAHGLRVLLIAVQFFPQRAVFEVGAKYGDQRRDDGEHERGDRIEQDGRAEGEQDGAGVTWMAKVGVGAVFDDLVAAIGLDVARPRRTMRVSRCRGS